MPAFGAALSREQIARVVEYVRSFCTDGRWPRGELNLPRPIATEKAYPEDEVVIEASAVTRAGERSVTTTAVYEKRWGARAQWELAVPVITRERTSAAGGRWTGLEIGDLAVGFKRVLLHGGAGILSLGGEIKVPVGDVETGTGAGTFRFEPVVLGGLALPANGFVQFQGAVEIPADRAKAEREALWRAVLGTTLGGATRAVSPMLELEWVRALESGAVTEWSLTPQVQIALSRRQHILANFGVRLPLGDAVARASRPRELVAYLLWDWFDGGLFQGW
jgi:hypothetical protein